MSDMTSSMGFAPAAAAPAPRRPARRRRGSAEYRAYYALVLAVALPLATLSFARDALRGRPGAAPLRRARAQARAIAPMIFAP